MEVRDLLGQLDIKNKFKIQVLSDNNIDIIYETPVYIGNCEF